MRTGLVTLLTLAGAFGAFLWEREVRGTSLAAARTAVVTVIVTVDVFYLLNCRSLLRSPFEMGVFGNRWVFLGIAAMVLAQALFAHAPAMNRLFGTAPIDGAAWLYAIGIGVAAYLVVEVEKRLRLRREEGLVPPRTPLAGAPLTGA